MKQFWLICTFLYVCCTTNGQHLDGDSLFSAGDYRLAAVAYEGAFLNSEDPQIGNVYLLKKSNCYKVLKEYEHALKILGRTNIPKSDSLYQIVLKERILLHFLNDEYPESYSLVLKAKLQGLDQDPDFVLMEFLNLVGLGRWEEARDFLLKNSEAFGLEESHVNELFQGKLKPKDPERAYNLSLFFPGVGQMYAGHPFKGLFSGGIQTLLIGFSAYSIWRGYFFTGGLTGVALFYTFYFGGARHARNLAEVNNVKRSKAIQTHFLSLVQIKKPSEEGLK